MQMRYLSLFALILAVARSQFEFPSGPAIAFTTTTDAATTTATTTTQQAQTDAPAATRGAPALSDSTLIFIIIAAGVIIFIVYTAIIGYVTWHVTRTKPQEDGDEELEEDGKFIDPKKKAPGGKSRPKKPASRDSPRSSASSKDSRRPAPKQSGAQKAAGKIASTMGSRPRPPAGFATESIPNPQGSVQHRHGSKGHADRRHGSRGHRHGSKGHHSSRGHHHSSHGTGSSGHRHGSKGHGGHRSPGRHGSKTGETPSPKPVVDQDDDIHGFSLIKPSDPVVPLPSQKDLERDAEVEKLKQQVEQLRAAAEAAAGATDKNIPSPQQGGLNVPNEEELLNDMVKQEIELLRSQARDEPPSYFGSSTGQASLGPATSLGQSGSQSRPQSASPVNAALPQASSNQQFYSQQDMEAEIQRRMAAQQAPVAPEPPAYSSFRGSFRSSNDIEAEVQRRLAQRQAEAAEAAAAERERLIQQQVNEAMQRVMREEEIALRRSSYVPPSSGLFTHAAPPYESSRRQSNYMEFEIEARVQAELQRRQQALSSYYPQPDRPSSSMRPRAASAVRMMREDDARRFQEEEEIEREIQRRMAQFR